MKTSANTGKAVLERVRERHPQIYLMGVLSLLPKQTQKIESPLADLSDEEIEMIEEMLAASRAKLVKKLETKQHNGKTLELELELELEPADTKEK